MTVLLIVCLHPPLELLVRHHLAQVLHDEGALGDVSLGPDTKSLLTSLEALNHHLRLLLLNEHVRALVTERTRVRITLSEGHSVETLVAAVRFARFSWRLAVTSWCLIVGGGLHVVLDIGLDPLVVPRSEDVSVGEIVC